MTEAIQSERSLQHKVSRIVVGIVVAAGFTLIAMLVLGSLLPEKTQTQIAAEQCVREKGYGSWRGSLGVSLEEFCDLAARLHFHAKRQNERRRDYPELY